MDTENYPHNPPNPRPSPSPGRARRALTATLLILLILTVGFLRLWVFTPSVVLLNSMEPTLYANDRVLVNRWAYHKTLPHVGDIILLHHPGEPESSLVFKRVIGTPGDRLAVARGYVMRNGKFLDERGYTLQDPLTVPPEWMWLTVPPQSVFVLGDNRNHSEDSRDYGPVPWENIVGRAVLIFWPWSRWQRLDPPPTAETGGNRRRTVP